MHCNAQYYVREQFEANGTQTSSYRNIVKKEVRALADGNNWLTECKKLNKQTNKNPLNVNTVFDYA